MKLSGGEWRLAATDLANHVACGHLTTLNVQVAHGVPLSIFQDVDDGGEPPPPPKNTTQVEALPDRNAFEIRWPNVIRIETVVRPTMVVDWAKVEALTHDPSTIPISAELAPAVAGAADLRLCRRASRWHHREDSSARVRKCCEVRSDGTGKQPGTRAVTNMNDYFPPDDDDRWFDHPRLRHWRDLIQKRGARLKVEVRQEHQLLETYPAELYVSIEIGNDKQLEREPWSDQINRGLIKLAVRAVSIPNESLRFGLAFRDAFEPAEIEVGDGFFNAVLVHELASGPLAQTLSNTLAEIHASRPSRDSRSYPRVRDMILGAIQGRAIELTKDLGYPQPEAVKILASGLSHYLDQRFQISNRKLLGFA